MDMGTDGGSTKYEVGTGSFVNYTNQANLSPSPIVVRNYINSVFSKEDFYFAKLRPDAIIPSKRDEDGAYDLYANFENKSMIINPNEVVKIPTGIASAFDKKYRIVFQERGSTGIIGLKVNAGLIDSGFRGEWFVILNNTNNVPIMIHKDADSVKYTDFGITYPYSKAICQFKVQEVPQVNIHEITLEELESFESKRGSGCIGSSNK